MKTQKQYYYYLHNMRSAYFPINSDYIEREKKRGTERETEERERERET